MVWIIAGEDETLICALWSELGDETTLFAVVHFKGDRHNADHLKQELERYSLYHVNSHHDLDDARSRLVVRLYTVEPTPPNRTRSTRSQARRRLRLARF